VGQPDSHDHDEEPVGRTVRGWADGAGLGGRCGADAVSLLGTGAGI